MNRKDSKMIKPRKDSFYVKMEKNSTEKQIVKIIEVKKNSTDTLLK